MRRLIPGGDGPHDGPRDLTDAQLAELMAYPTKPDGRPWVRAVFVSTLDGAAQGPDGRAGSISGEPDRRFFALTRAMADVILVGAQTARVEGYGPAIIRAEHAGLRASLGYTEPPPIAIVSTSLEIPEALLDDPRTIVLTCDGSPKERRTALAERVEVVVATATGGTGTALLDPALALAALAERGFTKVSCEGGPTLYAGLLAAGLVDDHLLTYAPMLEPGDELLRVTHGQSLEAPAPVRLAALLEEDDYLFSRWLPARLP